MSARSVLVVGAGKRVRETALPAFARIAESFEVTRVLARTARPLEVEGRTYAVTPLASLTQAELSAAELCYVAVAKDAVPAVLARLAELDRSRTTLLLDTPVVRFKHYRHVARLAGWRSVQVAEDTVELPWIEALNAAVATGAIGAPREARFHRSAYAYHGIAVAKRLLGARHVTWARRRALGGKEAVRTLRFAGGARAVIEEPRDYAIGSLELVGTRGSIGDRPGAGLVLEPLLRGGTWTGFRAGDATVELDEREIDLLRRGDPRSGVIARTDELKRVGFLRLLRALAAGRGAYPLEEGLDDMLIDYHLEKLGFYAANPLTSQRSPLARLVLGTLTRAGG